MYFKVVICTIMNPFGVKVQMCHFEGTAPVTKYNFCTFFFLNCKKQLNVAAHALHYANDNMNK